MHWEPWVPERGQRVRIRRSAECPYRDDFLHSDHEPDGTEGEVWFSFSDMVGEKPNDGHDLMVAFGQDAEGRTSTGWFAACELEPVL
jgi:hypothetical protein